MESAKREVAIPENVMPEIIQAANAIRQAQGSFNKICDIVLKSMDKTLKDGEKVNVNFDKKVFEIGTQE